MATHLIKTIQDLNAASKHFNTQLFGHDQVIRNAIQNPKTSEFTSKRLSCGRAALRVDFHDRLNQSHAAADAEDRRGLASRLDQDAAALNITDSERNSANEYPQLKAIYEYLESPEPPNPTPEQLEWTDTEDEEETEDDSKKLSSPATISLLPVVSTVSSVVTTAPKLPSLITQAQSDTSDKDSGFGHTAAQDDDGQSSESEWRSRWFRNSREYQPQQASAPKYSGSGGFNRNTVSPTPRKVFVCKMQVVRCGPPEYPGSIGWKYEETDWRYKYMAPFRVLKPVEQGLLWKLQDWERKQNKKFMALRVVVRVLLAAGVGLSVWSGYKVSTAVLNMGKEALRNAGERTVEKTMEMAKVAAAPGATPTQGPLAAMSPVPRAVKAVVPRKVVKVAKVSKVVKSTATGMRGKALEKAEKAFLELLG